MITNTELKYVGLNPREVPFPDMDYARNAIDKLKTAYSIYKEKYYKKHYDIILSNGEEIEFKIGPSNLCHLLGIDYPNILNDYMSVTRDIILDFGLYDTFNSYELLKRIIEKEEDVINNDSACQNTRILNYYKVLVKCSAFEKLSNFISFNFGCINFDKITFEEIIGKDFKPNSTKFFFVPTDDTLVPYILFGLVYNENSSCYAPETIFITPDFYKLFINQELLLPVDIVVHDNVDLYKLTATSSDKLYLLRMYKSILEYYQTNSFINIYNDYETVLKINSTKENTKKLVL